MEKPNEDSNENKKQRYKLTFDDLLNQKIGFGNFQYYTLIILGFINFNDGSEQILTTLMNPILQKDWKLSDFQVSILGSCFFLGMFFGNVTSGHLSDQIGRRKTMIYSTILQFILVTSTAILVQEIIFMTILRFLYGFVNGMTLPLSYVVISEIIPQLQRGRANICPVFFELLGKWYTMLLGYFFMSSFSQGNWRMMAFFNVIPCIIVLFGNHRYLKESPRFLLQNQQEQAIRIINEIGHMNKPALYTPLNDTEINGLKKEAQRAKRAQLQNEVHIQDLFNYKNKQITIIFWTIGIFMNFMLSANLFLLPFLLALENREMKDYAYTNGGDILALILVYYSIDRQNIGRKNSLKVAFTLQILTMLLIYIYGIKFLILGQVISNFLQRICFQSLNVMVTENYNTQYRSMGVGYYYGLSRLAGAIAPLLINLVFSIEPYLQFLIYAFINLICLYSIIKFPKDLTNQQLDQYTEMSFSDDSELKEQLLYIDSENNIEQTKQINIPIQKYNKVNK